jgi:hypothetical protein
MNGSGTRWWMEKNRTGLGFLRITLGYGEEKAQEDDENNVWFPFLFNLSM